MKKKLEIGMRSLKEMGADVLDVWNNDEAGRKVSPREALYFASMQQLLSVLTPALESAGGAQSFRAAIDLCAGQGVGTQLQQCPFRCDQVARARVDRQKRQGKRVCTLG